MPEVSFYAPTPDWELAQSRMRRIWDKTPGGAKTIARLLDTIADLKTQPASAILPD